VRLIRASDLQTIAVSADPTVPLPRPLTAADESNVELVLRTAQPTLLVTGPRRLPQARTNARRASSLAVPVLRADRPVGVVYATRYAVEQFAEEDLHWLTAYATTAAAPIFD
jgi:dolichol-phosphate mannosyltransferase